jgi:3-hydroxyacyl-CoA dehydrogenase
VLPVNRVAVVGSGTMGGGIAMVFANAGIPVLLKDVDEAALELGMGKIRKNYATSVQRGRFTQAFVDERLQMITPVLNYDAGSPSVDMVMEAVFEGMALKKTVFADLDRACRPGAILASNTSTLNIDEIAGSHVAAGSGDWNTLLQSGQRDAPARDCARKEVEQRSDCHLHATLQETGQDRSAGRELPRLRRQPHVWPLSTGGAVSDRGRGRGGGGRSGARRIRQRHGSAGDGRLAGLDVGWRIRKEYRHLEKPGIRQPFAEDRLCEMGRYGQKTLRGWYQL